MKKIIQGFTTIAPIEIREAGDSKTIVGLIPYNSRSVSMWGEYEIITETAFAKTLAESADVKALFNHDDSKILGRTKNGTLRLSNGMIGEQAGLLCELDLAETTYARDLYSLIKRNDVNTMSFGFYPVKERVENEGEDVVHYLLEVRLIEVSFGVPFPAYEETTSMVRGIDLGKVEMVLGKDKEQLTNEDRMTLENLNKTISTLIEPSVKSDTGAAGSTPAAEFIASLLEASRKKG